MFRLCSPLVRINPTGLMKFSGIDMVLRLGARWVRVPTNFLNSNVFCEVFRPYCVRREGSIVRYGGNMAGTYRGPQFLMWHCNKPLFNLHILLPQYKAGPSITLHTHTITNHFNSSYTPKLLFSSAAAPYRRNSNWFLLHYQGHKTPGHSFQVSVLCT